MIFCWVTRRTVQTVVGNWHFDNPCESHLQSQVTILVSWKFKAFFNFQLTLTITRLRRWPPHRPPKHQSPKTVFLRTPITQMISFNQGMLLLGSNHFLNQWSNTKSSVKSNQFRTLILSSDLVSSTVPPLYYSPTQTYQSLLKEFSNTHVS